jgi:hypothetical protein
LAAYVPLTDLGGVLIMQEIMWAPVLLFLSILTGFALIEHLRTRTKKKGYRSSFRRMQSPYARARHRSQPATPRAAFTRPHHAGSRRGFAR